MTVDIAGIGFHPLDAEEPARVEISRVTFRTSGQGAPEPARALIAGVQFFATGGPAPEPGRVHISGLHFFTRDPAPIAGQSLLHMWDGTRLVQVHPFVWDGTGVSPT